MKRRGCLGAISSVVLAGCSSSQNTDSKSNQKSSEKQDSDEETDTTETTEETGRFDDYITSRGIRIGIDDIEVGNSIRFESESLLEHDSTIAVLVAVTVENVSDGTRNLPNRDDFSLLAGTDQFEAVVGPFSGDEIIDPISGEPYYGQTDVHPGIVEEGWLFFEVPRAVSDITIAWSHPLDDAERHEWTATIDPGRLPELRVSSVGINEPVRIGEDSEIAVSIANEGGTEGTYSADYELELPLDSGSGRLHQEIAAGDTETWTTKVEPRGLGNGLFEIEDEDIALEFSVAGALHQFGDTVQTPDPENASVTVHEPALVSWYEYEDYDGTHRVESRPDEQFAIIQIEAENRTTSTVNGFDRRNISLIGSGVEYEYSSFEGYGATDLVSPVEGSELYGSGIYLSAGESETYIVLFEIPENLGVDDLAFSAEWHLEQMTDTKVTWQ